MESLPRSNLSQANHCSTVVVPQKRKRIASVDCARGLGIILVAAGHVYDGTTLQHYIFLFHMPLFFILSGYVFSPTDLRQLLARRIMSLLVPYAAYLAAVIALDLSWCAIDGRSPSIALSPPQLFVARVILGGSALHDTLGTFWFITCLFGTNIAYGVLSLRLGAANRPRVIAVIIALLVLAYALPPVRTPWAIAQLPVAIFFFWAGAFFRHCASELRWAWFLAFAVFGLCAPLAGSFDMKYMLLGLAWWNVPVALAASYLVMRLAQLIGRTGILNDTFVELGQASLVIMFLHKLIQVHLADRLPLLLTFFLSLFLPWCVYRLFMRSPYVVRVLFLGQGKVPQALRLLLSAPSLKALDTTRASDRRPDPNRSQDHAAGVVDPEEE